MNIFNLLYRFSVPGLIHSIFEPLWKGKNSFYGQIIDKLKGVASQDISDPSSVVGSFINKETQAGPTGVMLHQEERDDTAFQRQVADMQAAGLNPAMMYGGSSSPVVNTSAAASPGAGISDLLQLVMLPLQMKSLQADIDKTKADTESTKVQTEGQQISNSWIDLLNEAKVASDNAKANFDNAQASVVIEKAKAEITSLIESAKSESYKRVLMSAQAYLAEANAEKVYALLPFEQALIEADIEHTNAQTSYTLVQKLYQQKLIDSGYIESVIRSANANATVDEVEAWLSSDQFNRENESKFERILHSFVSGLNTAVKIVSPIKSSRTSNVEVNKTSNSNVSVHRYNH